MKLYKNKLVDLLLEAKGDINWNAFIEHEAALIAMNDLKFGTKRKWVSSSLQKKIKEAVEYGVPFGSNIGDYSMSKAAATKGNKKNKEIIELIISAYNATGSNLRASFEKYANMRFGQINQVFFRLYYTPTKGYKSDIHLRKPKINIKDTHAVKVDSEYGFNIVDKYKQVLYRMKVKTGTMRIQANKNIRGDVISRWNALAGLKEGDEYQAAAATQTLAQAQSASDYQPGPAPSDSVAGASAGEYSIEDFLVEEGVDVGVSDEIEGISLTQDAQIEIPQWEIEL
jgi:hypothetical protein